MNAITLLLSMTLSGKRYNATVQCFVSITIGLAVSVSIALVPFSKCSFTCATNKCVELFKKKFGMSIFSIRFRCCFKSVFSYTNLAICKIHIISGMQIRSIACEVIYESIRVVCLRGLLTRIECLRCMQDVTWIGISFGWK